MTPCNRTSETGVTLSGSTATQPKTATVIYSERWEIETAFAELQTSQKGPGRVLRSKSPDMVRQEVWAFLLTHYAIRDLICQAAEQADTDPDRLSFIRSLRIVRRQVTDQAEFSRTA